MLHPDVPSPSLLLVLVACAQTVICAGVIFGWASIAGTLLVAPFEEGGANLTIDETTSIFSVAACTSALSSLLLGYVLDSRGPRICSLMAHAFVAVGCYLFASATSYRGFLIGASLMAFGGPGIQTAVVHLANLYPDQKFTVMSCISGSVSLSFAILPLFDLLWGRYGVGFRVMFHSYLLPIALSAVTAQLFWPDKPYEEDTDKGQTRLDSRSPYPQPTPERAFADAAAHTHLVEAPLGSYLRSNSRHQLSRHLSYRQSVVSMLAGNYASLSLKDQPFWCQLCSGEYVRALLVFCCTFFMANFYVASLPTELADLNHFSPEAQHGIARTFTLISSIGVLAAFLIGWLMDHAGLVTCTTLTIVMGQLHMLIIIFCNDKPIAMVVGFFVYTLFRQFLFPVYIACLSSRLGFKYFGILNGLGFAVSGVTQLFISALVRTVKGTCYIAAVEGCYQGSWKELHIAQLCLLSALMAVPITDAYLANRSRLPVSADEVRLLIQQDDYASVHQHATPANEYDEGILI